jgi:formylglycine-generating enzyme required for sulfatase activity
VPEPEEEAPKAPAAKSGFQVPSAFSNQPTVAIPAVPEPPEERPAAKSGFQVPSAFSNQPTVAIPAVPDREGADQVGVQPPAGFSPLPTVSIPAVPDSGDDAISGHATPAGFSGSPTLAFPSVPGSVDEQVDPYSTFDPNKSEPPLSASQGLATTVIAVPQMPQSNETAVISGMGTDRVSASATDPNMPGFEPSPPAFAGTASVPSAEVKTTQVEKAAGAAGGSSALKWVAVAVVAVAVLAAVVAVGLFVWRPWSSPEPTADAQPATPVTAPTTAPATPPQPQEPVVPDGMVAVAGGSFQIGSDAADADVYSKPAHSVTVKPFFIDKTEVTNAQYKEFVDKTGHTTPTGWAGGTFPPGADQLPVVNVTWRDAVAYATWAGKRLPTEAEWEVAARGADGRLYPWGSNWDASAANVDQKAGGLKPVGSSPRSASPCGADDMVGNVWEWTATDYEPYPGSTATWPKDDAGKERRPIKIIRGGAFSTGSKVNATWRGFYEPDKPGDRLGFRCAKDAS